jgi:hypothetical protein
VRAESPPAPRPRRNAKGKFGLRAAGVHIDGVPRLRAVSLGEEALERTDRDRLIDLSAAAGRLAGMSADAPADAGQADWARARAVGLFKLALCNELNIAAGVGVRGTGHHAGEVGVQPIPVNLLVDEAFAAWGPSLGRKGRAARGRLFRPRIYLLSVKSAAVSPATFTGLDLLFAPSCHAVTV